MTSVLWRQRAFTLVHAVDVVAAAAAAEPAARPGDDAGVDTLGNGVAVTLARRGTEEHVTVLAFYGPHEEADAVRCLRWCAEHLAERSEQRVPRGRPLL